MAENNKDKKLPKINLQSYLDIKGAIRADRTYYSRHLAQYKDLKTIEEWDQLIKDLGL